MNMTQTTALLDQLLEGRELSEVLTDYQALTANHTTPLGLNQWQLSDKPTMAQFNSDNEIIDGKLRELDSALANKAGIIAPTITEIATSGNFTGTINCCRSNVGVVTLSGNFSKSSSPIVSETIATLSESFRPSYMFPFVLVSQNSLIFAGFVDPTGTIRFANVTIPSGYLAGSAIYFNVTFPAAF